MFRPTSVLLDKGTVREALRAVVRVERGSPLPPRQDDAYHAILEARAAGIALYATPELLHILEHPASAPLIQFLLPDLRPLLPGRYLRRWARRLRDEGVSREDALIVSYASFGVDREAQTLGTQTIVTTDLALRDRIWANRAWLAERFGRMVTRLPAPYCGVQLPKLLSPPELIALLR